jgi:hypothetical protein
MRTSYIAEAPAGRKEAEMAERKRIDRKTIDRVIAMRTKGMGWQEIMEKLDKPRQFVLDVRPLMKAIDPTLVRPSYDRQAKKSDKKRGAKASRVGRVVPKVVAS